jgi:hypothetical protein
VGYILQSVDEVLAPTAEEEAGLEEAASSLDRGEGFTTEEFRVLVRGAVRRRSTLIGTVADLGWARPPTSGSATTLPMLGG